MINFTLHVTRTYSSRRCVAYVELQVRYSGENVNWIIFHWINDQYRRHVINNTGLMFCQSRKQWPSVKRFHTSLEPHLKYRSLWDCKRLRRRYINYGRLHILTVNVAQTKRSIIYVCFRPATALHRILFLTLIRLSNSAIIFLKVQNISNSIYMETVWKVINTVWRSSGTPGAIVLNILIHTFKHIFLYIIFHFVNTFSYFFSNLIKSVS